MEEKIAQKLEGGSTSPIFSEKYALFNPIEVPSSKGGRLLSMLATAEPRFAKFCGYQVKLVESSGTPLSLLFNKRFSSRTCHRLDCAVCRSHQGKGPSLCKMKGVVYSSVCLKCEERHKRDLTKSHRGRYIGETGRTLFERAREHRANYRNCDFSSFMFKHWALEHSDEIEPPKFSFKVVKKHSDALSRMVHEAVLIGKLASLNSKSEWHGYQIKRLTINKNEWEKKVEFDQGEVIARNENDLRDRVKDLRSKAKSNQFLTSRKGLLQDSHRMQTSAKKLKVFIEVTETAAPNEAVGVLTGITAAVGPDLTAKSDNDAALNSPMTPKPASASLDQTYVLEPSKTPLLEHHKPGLSDTAQVTLRLTTTVASSPTFRMKSSWYLPVPQKKQEM